MTESNIKITNSLQDKSEMLLQAETTLHELNCKFNAQTKQAN